MNLKLTFALFFTIFTTSFAQQLNYQKGHIYNSENKKLTNSQVIELLNSQPELVAQFNAGRTKKTVGTILLAAGIGFIVGDLASGATQDITYPTAFTYVGIASIIISIPVKIGYTNKIKSAVEGYNKQVASEATNFKLESTRLYANQNGLGILLTF